MQKEGFFPSAHLRRFLICRSSRQFVFFELVASVLELCSCSCATSHLQHGIVGSLGAVPILGANFTAMCFIVKHAWHHTLLMIDLCKYGLWLRSIWSFTKIIII